MEKKFNFIVFILIFTIMHTNLAYANFFLTSTISDNQQKINVGYKLKFGTDYRTTQQKLNADTAYEENFFDSIELETISFLLLLAFILTAVRGTGEATSTSGSGAQDGEVFSDSRLVPTSEEIKASETVTEAGIPQTNIPVATE